MKKIVALNSELIVTIVDGGMGNDVVDYAKEAGAKGGTILHGRGSGVHDAGTFFGLEIEPEKDVVLVIVPESMTNKVLKKIGEGIKIAKPGNGVCFVVELAKLIGITRIDQYDAIELEDFEELDNQ